MKVLVAVADYPNNNGGVLLMYVHARNKYYIAHGIDVTVLNFAAKQSYNYDGIDVVSLKEYEENFVRYDVLICHAANIRNHYLFLKKHGDDFPKFVFFFHGHEVLKVRETYQHAFPYVKNSGIANSVLQDIYDSFKFIIWNHYYRKIAYKSKFIFVSNWMVERFERYVKLNTDDFDSYIIPNNVGEIFEKETYDEKTQKEYDFVTIRSRLDGWKYCIDLVNEWAYANPEFKFLVVGNGEYFSHYKKADNIELRLESLHQSQIPEVLNSARVALMPTRLDAQGVMMCEMATYGIPLITSNIDICRELEMKLNNILLIENEKSSDLKTAFMEACKLYDLPKNTAFFADETVGKEILVIKGIANEDCN